MGRGGAAPCGPRDRVRPGGPPGRVPGARDRLPDPALLRQPRRSRDPCDGRHARVDHGKARGQARGHRHGHPGRPVGLARRPPRRLRPDHGRRGPAEAPAALGFEPAARQSGRRRRTKAPGEKARRVLVREGVDASVLPEICVIR
ncbi:hypothetical protein GPN2_12301 [Streptomyces murinus]